MDAPRTAEIGRNCAGEVTVSANLGHTSPPEFLYKGPLFDAARPSHMENEGARLDQGADMKNLMKKNLFAAGAVVFAVALSGLPALADDAAPAPAPQAGDHFEIHDNADTVPLNHRSNEDPRYDTQKQHEAEMYAEQYEKKRAEEALKQKKLLDGMNRLSPNNDRTGSGAGATGAGFPANVPY
jgi:hypothetical protein